MNNKKLSVSSKFALTIASLYSFLIIILSVFFHYILINNSKFLRNALLSNNEYFLLKKTGLIIEKLKKDNIKNIDDLSMDLKRFCLLDSDFLYIIIFSQTPDENYFRVQKKMSLASSMEFGIKKHRLVQEDKDINFLKKGLFKNIVDPKIYYSNGKFWQCVYYPFKVRKMNIVIEFIVLTTKTITSLNEYSEAIDKTKKYIIFVTCSVIFIVIIITLLFVQNFSLVLKNISKNIQRAAKGDLNINIDPSIDNDFSELALSFNILVDEIKGLKEKEEIIPGVENKDIFTDIFKQGVHLLKSGNMDDSIAIFKALIILRPEGFGSYFNLGVAYAKKRNYRDSSAMFQRALTFNPNHKLALNYLAKIKRLLNEKSSP